VKEIVGTEIVVPCNISSVTPKAAASFNAAAIFSSPSRSFSCEITTAPSFANTQLPKAWSR